MLTYHVEDFRELFEKLEPLLERHWREIALDQERVPLAVDYARYRQFAASGHLAMIGAWDSGKLVGYIAAIVSTHLHYASTLFAAIDVFWLDPAYRAGLNGLRLFTELEAELKRRGVVKMIGQTKLAADKDVSKLYEYLGWSPVETLFAKVIQ